MQIVKRFGTPRASSVPYPNLESALPFENNNLILVRFIEKDILTDSITLASNVRAVCAGAGDFFLLLL